MEKSELKELYAEKNKSNPFIAHNHIEVEEVERDRAVLSLEINDECRNLYGFVHGGAMFAMADNAAGCAATTDGRKYVTESGSINFLRNQAEGRIFADARVRHRGRTITLVETDILGDSGTLLATASFSYFCLSPDGDEPADAAGQ